MTSEEFQLVIRRAAELQSRQGEGDDEGVSETEVIRIGRELGLSGIHLQQAIAESAGVPAEKGVLRGVFGPGTATAGRLIHGDAETVIPRLESHLVERQYLAVQRRHSDRISFVHSPGMLASIGRGMSQAFGSELVLNVDNLDVSFRQVEQGSVWVSLSSSLQPSRATAASVSVGLGGVSSFFIGAFVWIGIAPLAALAALPVLGGSVLIARSWYERRLRDTTTRLESLLDRLETGDLTGRARRIGP
jgi:hypothetical protein